MAEAVVYHLDHSGTAVEAAGRLLVFDYFNDSPAGDKRDMNGGVISGEDLKKETGVDVFVSHGHRDHFNPVIYDWVEINPEIRYFLSSDLPGPVFKEQEGMEGKDADGKKVEYYLLDSDQEIKLDDLQVNTYGSTDRGVSFLVEAAGLTIFHAGDLNWWHWKSFSESELKEEEEAYKGEVDRLKGKSIDIAFIPVDPRLEGYYYLAGEYFAREIRPDLLVPIHFADNFSITTDFREKISVLPVRSAEIRRRGQTITYKKDR